MLGTDGFVWGVYTCSPGSVQSVSCMYAGCQGCDQVELFWNMFVWRVLWVRAPLLVLLLSRPVNLSSVSCT